MNGLTQKTSKLGPNLASDIGSLGMLAIAIASVTAVLYVMATAFTGGGMA